MCYILKKILLAGAVILILSACGKEKTPEERRISGQQQVLAKKIQEEKVLEATPFAVYYHVCLEENRLVIYQVTSMGAECVSSVEIEQSYYPAEDISELKQGIKAYSKEGAFEILENFTN